MESPRPTVLALDERMDRCNGTREPLGEVMGKPRFTKAITGETIPEIKAKSTKGVREELAGLSWCSPADVILLSGGEILSDDQDLAGGVSVVIQKTFEMLGLFGSTLPPDPPTNLGPSARSFVGDPSSYVKSVFRRLQSADAQVFVHLQTWQLEIDFFDSLFHHCKAHVRIYNGCSEIARAAGDGVAFGELKKTLRGDKSTPAPVDPLVWTPTDVGDILETLPESEGFSLILRYNMFPDAFVDDLRKRALGLLQGKVDVSFLAARMLRELAERGKLCGSGDMSRALLGAGPLVARELVAAIRAIE